MSHAFEIEAVDHIEIATRDLLLTEQLYHKLGFETLTTRTLSERSLQSKLLGQNNVYIILSQSTDPNDAVSKYVTAHGEGILSVTLRTKDAFSMLEYVHSRGAKVVTSPKTILKDYGEVTVATIASVGSTQIHFLSREGQLFLEGFDYALKPAHKGYGLTSFDHFSMVVPKDSLFEYTKFLSHVLGMEEISYGTSSPHKIYLKYKNFHIVLNEPETPDSEQAKFIEAHHGAGFDHIAFGTNDIIASINDIQKSQIPFKKASHTFYEDLLVKRPDLSSKIPELSKLNIVSHGTQEEGLLQAATLYLHGYNYFEFVERHHFEWLGTAVKNILKD